MSRRRGISSRKIVQTPQSTDDEVVVKSEDSYTDIEPIVKSEDDYTDDEVVVKSEAEYTDEVLVKSEPESTDDEIVKSEDDYTDDETRSKGGPGTDPVAEREDGHINAEPPEDPRIALLYIYTFFYTYVLGSLTAVGPPHNSRASDARYWLLPVVLVGLVGTTTREVYRLTGAVGSAALVLLSVYLGAFITMFTAQSDNAIEYLMFFFSVFALPLASIAYTSPDPEFASIHLKFMVSAYIVVVWRYNAFVAAATASSKQQSWYSISNMLSPIYSRFSKRSHAPAVIQRVNMFILRLLLRLVPWRSGDVALEGSSEA